MRMSGGGKAHAVPCPCCGREGRFASPGLQRTDIEWLSAVSPEWFVFTSKNITCSVAFQSVNVQI